MGSYWACSAARCACGDIRKVNLSTGRVRAGNGIRSQVPYRNGIFRSVAVIGRYRDAGVIYRNRTNDDALVLC